MKVLPVINACELFIRRLQVSLVRFPKEQKFVFRQKCNEFALRLWEELVEAEFYHKAEIKHRHLDSALLVLQKLQALLRLCKELGFLGYVSAKDMAQITGSKEMKDWSRPLTSEEQMRKDATHLRRCTEQYMILSKMLSDIKEQINSIKYAKL